MKWIQGGQNIRKTWWACRWEGNFKHAIVRGNIFSKPFFINWVCQLYQLTTYTNITYIFIHQPLPDSQLPATHQLLQATFITVGKTNLTNIAIMSTTHTWSVAEDHNLVSVPSKNNNHLYAQYSSLTLSLHPHFPYMYIFPLGLMLDFHFSISCHWQSSFIGRNLYETCTKPVGS